MAHIPVLLREVITFLDPKPGEFMIDGTLGGGGYARAILERLAGDGKFLGIDLDSAAVERARAEFGAYREKGIQIFLEAGNYADLPRIVQEKSLPRADGLALDLGFSSDELEASGRGFSFLRDEPLIMTYEPEAKPVRDVIRELGEQELAETIKTFGEERFAARIARAIKERLRRSRIETSRELAEVIRGAVPRSYERGRIHPATRTFQALRIYANRELENLERLLSELPAIMNRGGRVVIVSFHSLEDRIVKQSFQALARSGAASALSKKPVTTEAGEARLNPRSRSAKLRAIAF